MLCADPGRKDAVQAEPHKAFDELVHRESVGSDGERSSRRCRHAGEGDDTDGRKDPTATKFAVAEKHMNVSSRCFCRSRMIGDAAIPCRTKRARTWPLYL